MSFGGQTVTVVTFEIDDHPDNLGVNKETPVETPVGGCRFRPLTFSETAQTEFDVSTQIWKCTAPPVSAILAADSTGYLRVDGNTYSIVAGPELFTDMEGAPFKVTLLATKHDG